MSDVRTVTRLMQKLSIHSDRQQTLEELKSYLASTSSSVIKNVLKARDLLGLFDCFNTENTNQIENACSILSTLLPIVDPVHVASQLSAELQNGLENPNHSVKELALKELGQIIAVPEGIRILTESPEIIERAASLVSEEEATALKAVKFLSEFGCASPLAATMMLKQGDNAILSIFLSAIEANSITRYRVFEIACNIQSESEEMLDLCLESGIIQRLTAELSGDDPLTLVTCCTMLANMASSRHSLNYLIHSGVLLTMTELLKEAPHKPFSNLYMPGVIRFFGKLCFYNDPDILAETYPNFITLLFDLLAGDQANTIQVAMETIGMIGETNKGKFILYSEGKKCSRAIKEICQLMCHGPQDLRSVATNSVCQLLKWNKEISESESVDFESITLEWFKLISEDPVDSIVALCKLPFMDIRCCGFNLLTVVASAPWGLTALVEYPVLCEFLLDRNTETKKECKEAKFEAVRKIASSSECASIFGNQNYLRFRQFVKEGPFYVEAAMSVAIEDA